MRVAGCSVFDGEKEMGFSPRTVSSGISAIICDACPLPPSCMSRERKQSQPRAYSLGGVGGGCGASTLPHCSSGDRNRQVAVAHQATALQFIVTGLASTEKNKTPQQTIKLNKIMPLRIHFSCQVCV